MPFDDLNTLVCSKGSIGIPRVRAVVALLKELGLGSFLAEEAVCLSEEGMRLVSAPEDIVHGVGLILFSRMIDEGVIPTSSVLFDVPSGCYTIKQVAIKSRFAAFRNLLIVANVLEVRGSLFLICPEAESIIRGIESDWKGGMSPEQLMAKLAEDRKAGELAEQYVMAYERDRLGDDKAGKIEQVSLTSVSAGFDIASFETSASVHFDRLIEVKAYGGNGFFLSSGELEAARRYGRSYYIYVVDLSKIGQRDYAPLMIQDPANYLKTCADWRVVPDRLRITRLSSLQE